MDSKEDDARDGVVGRVGSEGRNTRKILCPQCGVVILQAGKAEHIEKPFAYHRYKARAHESDTVEENTHWMVQDQFDFDNIGVTRSVDPTTKYLICSECEVGPLGLYLPLQKPLFYIATSRVAYSAH